MISLTESYTKSAKKKLDQANVIVDIIIKPLDNRPNVWHISSKMPNKDKSDETVIPRDVFGHALENYEALLNFFRALHHATDSIRKEMSRRAKNQILQKQNDPNQRNQKNTHHANEERKIFEAKKRYIDFLTGTTEKFKTNMKSESMLEQTALALALAEYSYKQIKKEIHIHKEFKVRIPITNYPDLSAMQQQHSISFLSVVESLMSIGSSASGFFR